MHHWPQHGQNDYKDRSSKDDNDGSDEPPQWIHSTDFGFTYDENRFDPYADNTDCLLCDNEFSILGHELAPSYECPACGLLVRSRG